MELQRQQREEPHRRRSQQRLGSAQQQVHQGRRTHQHREDAGSSDVSGEFGSIGGNAGATDRGRIRSKRRSVRVEVGRRKRRRSFSVGSERNSVSGVRSGVSGGRRNKRTSRVRDRERGRFSEKRRISRKLSNIGGQRSQFRDQPSSIRRMRSNVRELGSVSRNAGGRDRSGSVSRARIEPQRSFSHRGGERMPPVPLRLLRRDEPPKRNDRRGVMAPLATCRDDDPTAADCEPQLRAARSTPRTECDELGVLRPSSACLPRSDDPSLARLRRARAASLEKLHHASHNSETAFSGDVVRRSAGDRLVYGSIGSSDRPFARRAALRPVDLPF